PKCGPSTKLDFGSDGFAVTRLLGHSGPATARPRNRETIHNPVVRILGIDPGSITTGYGIIDYERGRLARVDQGSISTPRGAELSERLGIIHEKLLVVIARTQPSSVAVETPFAGHNVKSLIQLAHARGVILLAIRSAQLEMFEYSPRSVKSAVVGYGGAEKEQVAKMVPMLLSSLFGGVIADRIERKKIMLLSQYLQMTFAFILAALLLSGNARVEHIFILSFLTGSAQSFSGPAYISLLPLLVRREDVP